MKVIAINGSPRKEWNTDKILQNALDGCKKAGAETKMVRLYDLDYKGCRACFACKRLDSPTYGHCNYPDQLAPVIQEVLKADLLLIGSPIYFSDVSGQMRAFLERILFPGLAYDKKYSALYSKRIPTKLFFTMNMAQKDFYKPVFDQIAQVTNMILGPTEVIPVVDTLQFNDYSKYMAELFDADAKKKQHETVFPQDCQNAFTVGEKAAQEYFAAQK